MANKYSPSTKLYYAYYFGVHAALRESTLKRIMSLQPGFKTINKIGFLNESDAINFVDSFNKDMHHDEKRHNINFYVSEEGETIYSQFKDSDDGYAIQSFHLFNGPHNPGYSVQLISFQIERDELPF